MKALAPFVAHNQCRAAISVLEVVFPELRETTLLMRIAQLCSSRGAHTSHPAEGRHTAAEAMAYIHAQGFAHRDLKSQNILYHKASGRAKVADFGLARRLGSTQHQVAPVQGQGSGRSSSSYDEGSVPERTRDHGCGAPGRGAAGSGPNLGRVCGVGMVVVVGLHSSVLLPKPWPSFLL